MLSAPRSRPAFRGVPSPSAADPAASNSWALYEQTVRSTPFAKLLLGSIPPLLLAGLLYLGSGAGLSGKIDQRTPSTKDVIGLR